jgi:cyclophilin family peptidyl-prolyl cis-trans isomerase
MRNILITGLILGISVSLSGCRSVNPYPVANDTDMGLSDNQSNPNLGYNEGIGNIAPPINRPVSQSERRQVVSQSPTQIPVINQNKENMQAEFPKKVTIPNVSTMIIQTNKGEIKIKLYPNEAPETISNYVKKAQDKFYNGLTFHRVEDWVIQGGDPKGNGTGGGTMATELSTKEFKQGSVGVARGGDIKVSNDSQFFICTTDCSWLNGQYTLFGEVVEGMDVAKNIKIGDVIESVRVE